MKTRQRRKRKPRGEKAMKTFARKVYSKWQDAYIKADSKTANRLKKALNKVNKLIDNERQKQASGRGISVDEHMKLRRS